MNKLAFTVFVFIQSSLAFAVIEDGHWHAGIGDPTTLGWVIVAAYFLASARCIYKAIISKKFGGNYHFWIYLAVFLLLLGINKQLDLQSWFTQVMKDAAQNQGWYAHKKPLQFVFIAFLGAGMLITLIGLRLYLANAWRNYKLTWVGIVLLCTFVLMRAASFNHIDTIINYQVLGTRLNVILEISAILLIVLGTFFNKKYSNLLNADTISVKDYVNIAAEGDIVKCPQCGTQPLAKTIDGRVFKCRSCNFNYSVRLVDN